MDRSFNSPKCEYHLCRITAGTLREQYELSFNAHLNLETIHPWVDGNGKTARLLMNYIQYCNNLFPTKVFKEDRGDNILSLQQSQDAETNQPFLEFMATQLKKTLSQEINTLSEIIDRIVPKVKERQSRTLENMYTILWLDAMHYKVKDGG